MAHIDWAFGPPFKERFERLSEWTRVLQRFYYYQHCLPLRVQLIF